MTHASLSKAEEKEETSTYFILDETGDISTCSSGFQFEQPEPKKDKVSGEESGTSEDVESREDEDIETIDENSNLSSSSDSSSMRSRMVTRSSIGDKTPRSAKMRRGGNKRKRRHTLTTPVIPKRTRPPPGMVPVIPTRTMPPGTPENVFKNKKKNKKKKKSVIVIGDSDSEPEETAPRLLDISVVEIDDDNESVIVLSDDEVGVCSGSLSTTKKPLQPRNIRNSQRPKTVARPQSSLAKPFVSMTKPQASSAKPLAGKSSSTQQPIPNFIEDTTGNYIPLHKPEEPQKDYFELYNPPGKSEERTGLRPIIIDGCNVAFGHGRDRFSCLGLKICVEYFRKMGHKVTVFVPQFRKTHLATVDPHLLEEMEKDGTLSFTPSRRTVEGKMIVSYDDRYIVQYADATGGVIVSRDNFRDLITETPLYKETIAKRLLMFTWVGDTIMFPKDPLGRGGPTLQEFLKFDTKSEDRG